MTLRRSMLAAACALATGTAAAAELHIPMAFEYIALNGIKVERSLLMHKSSLAMADGANEVTLRYNDRVDSEFSDTRESVTSAAFVVTFDAAGDLYLAPADGDRIRDPRQFAEAPQVVITRKDGSTVPITLTHTGITNLRDDSPLFHGGAAAAAPAAATAASVAVVANPTGVTEAAPAAAPPAAPVATTDNTPVQQADPAEMLRLWWQRADEKSRKEFLSWAVQQL